MNNEQQQPKRMRWGYDDIPKPFSKAFTLGVQHVLTMFGATISVPLILGPALGFDAGEIAVLVATVMLASGVATLLQVNLGIRIPIVQGVSFAFLGPFFAIIAATIAMGGDVSMQYIAGAIILGSIVQMAIGFSGLIGQIQKYVTPVIIGPVIVMIGLALFKVGAPIAGRDWGLALIVIVCGLLFSLILGRKIYFLSLFPVLSAVIVAYVVAWILTLTGVFQAGDHGYVCLIPIYEAEWFRWRIFFPWGWPRFDLAFFLIILAGYLASMIESYGDYHALNDLAEGPTLTGKQISRGIGMEGVGCFFTGLFGGFASTSYAENIGLVGLTRVASRYVVTIGAIVLVFLGIFGKFGGAVATIPMPIVGGLFCLLFGLIAAIGIAVMSRCDLTSSRNLMIIGFSLFMGMSLPVYIDASPIVIEWAGWLADIFNALGTTEMAIAAIIGLILDNAVPGTPEERGVRIAKQ